MFFSKALLLTITTIAAMNCIRGGCGKKPQTTGDDSVSANERIRRTEELVRLLHGVVKKIDGPDHAKEGKCTNKGGDNCCYHVYQQKTQDAIRQYLNLPQEFLDSLRWVYEVDYAHKNLYATSPDHEMSIYCRTKFMSSWSDRPDVWYDVNYKRNEQAVRVLCIAPDYEVLIKKVTDPATGAFLYVTGFCVPKESGRASSQSAGRLITSPMEAQTVLLNSVPITSNLMICTNVN